MILGFLGKGGSGKSSVSTQMALFLSKHNSILAIDADHNMDLSYNLTTDFTKNISPEHLSNNNDDNLNSFQEINYLGSSLADFQQAVGLNPDEKYTLAFMNAHPHRFTLSPLSNEINHYSKKLDNGVRLMVAGPQTETVLYGKACSHVLTTPLKILLPLLVLNENEVVVVDEKAGLDGVSTGIVTGVDVGIIICEPALHSIKTAKEIAKLMEFYGTPSLFVANKVASKEDEDFIKTHLAQEPVAFLKEEIFMKQNPSLPVDAWTDSLADIFEAAQKVNKNNRLERTIEKFKRNTDYEKNG